MADALRSGRSVREDVGVQISPSAPSVGACSSVGLERSPAEAQVVGSRPAKRARLNEFPKVEGFLGIIWAVSSVG